MPDGNKYAETVEILLDSFQSRFLEFTGEESNTKLYANPFVLPIEKLDDFHPDLQIEISSKPHSTKGLFL